MKDKGRKILFVLCIAVCVACIGYIVYYFLQRDKGEKKYEDVQKKVEKQIEEAEQKAPEETEEEKEDENPIDFAELKAVNPDIYAWITIPDTNINYPVLQTDGDDAYYLNHTYDGEKNPIGAIYTEKANSKDFTDFNTVIYGHNIKDGTMFENLHKFEDEQFFDTHETFDIYTEDGKKTYKVFAAVEFDNRHILYHFSNDDVKARKEFLYALRDSRNMISHYRDDVEVDENSRIVTLSTCVRKNGKRYPDRRYLVGAVEVNE